MAQLAVLGDGNIGTLFLQSLRQNIGERAGDGDAAMAGDALNLNRWRGDGLRGGESGGRLNLRLLDLRVDVAGHGDHGAGDVFLGLRRAAFGGVAISAIDAESLRDGLHIGRLRERRGRGQKEQIKLAHIARSDDSMFGA